MIQNSPPHLADDNREGTQCTDWSSEIVDTAPVSGKWLHGTCLSAAKEFSTNGQYHSITETFSLVGWWRKYLVIAIDDDYKSCIEDKNSNTYFIVFLYWRFKNKHLFNKVVNYPLSKNLQCHANILFIYTCSSGLWGRILRRTNTHSHEQTHTLARMSVIIIKLYSSWDDEQKLFIWYEIESK